MNTEQIVKMSLAAMIITGYGAVFIVYMLYAPPDNETMKSLMSGLTGGYLLVLGAIFGGKS